MRVLGWYTSDSFSLDLPIYLLIEESMTTGPFVDPNVSLPSLSLSMEMGMFRSKMIPRRYYRPSELGLRDQSRPENARAYIINMIGCSPPAGQQENTGLTRSSLFYSAGLALG